MTAFSIKLGLYLLSICNSQVSLKLQQLAMNQDRLFSCLVLTTFLLLLMTLLNHLLTPILALLALTALNSVDQLLYRVRLFIQF